MGAALLEAVERHQFLLCEVIQVCHIIDESALVEYHGDFLADAVNIHGMASHKVLDAAADLWPAAPFVGAHPSRLTLDALQRRAT